MSFDGDGLIRGEYCTFNRQTKVKAIGVEPHCKQYIFVLVFQLYRGGNFSTGENHFPSHISIGLVVIAVMTT